MQVICKVREKICECASVGVHLYMADRVQEAQSGRNWGHEKENYRK